MAKRVAIYGLRIGTDQFCYVGSSVRPKSRLKQHKQKLQAGKHCNSRLTWFLKGEDLDRLNVRIIERVNAEDRDKREYYWIQHCKDKGHPLQNIIWSITQEEYLRSRGSSSDQIILRAIRFIQQPPFILTERLAKSLAKFRAEIIEYVADFPERLSPEVKALAEAL